MKCYVQFMIAGIGNKEPIDILGSDGVFILDGRNSLDIWKQDAMKQAHRLRNIHPIIGWKIIKSSRFTDDPNKIICKWICSGALS